MRARILFPALLALILAAACTTPAATPTPTATPATKGPAATPTSAPVAPTPTSAVTLTAAPGVATPTPTARATVATPTPRVVATPTPAAATPTPAASRRGGTLKGITNRNTAVVDPVYYITPSENAWIWPSYNALLEHQMPDKPLDIGPALAESWVISPDRMSVTFKLRSGVRWHDGADFTSADVAYTYKTVQNPIPGQISQRKTDLQFIKSVDTPDARTAVINMSTPLSPSAMFHLATIQIAPKHVHETGGPLKGRAVGTGPFKMTRFEQQVISQWVRNPDYWQPGLPYLDAYEISYNADRSTAIAALAVKQVDAYIGPLQDEFIATLKSVKGIQTEGLDRIQLFGMAFNLDQKDKPWADVRVRQAVSCGLHRETAKAIGYRGSGTVTGPFPSAWYEGRFSLPADELGTFCGYGKSAADDLQKAKKLLQEAGYANGFTVDVMWEANLTEHNDMFEYAVSALEPLKINVRLRPVPAPTVKQRVADRDFEWVRSSTTRPTTDPADMFTWFLPGDANNSANWQNQQFVDLYQKQLTASEEERPAIVKEMNRLVLKDMSALIFQQPVSYFARWSHVKGWWVYPGQHYHATNSMRWIYLQR